MPGFELPPDALAVARADVEQARSALVGALGDVAAQVTSLVGTGWRGSAATAFGEGFDEWRRGAALVMEGLATTGELLGVTERAYVGSDDAASDVLTRLGSRLGGAAA